MRRKGKAKHPQNHDKMLQALENDKDFSTLVATMSNKLLKQISLSDSEILYSLYSSGLAPSFILFLADQKAADIKRVQGVSLPPTMHEIARLAAECTSRNIFDISSAKEYFNRRDEYHFQGEIDVFISSISSKRRPPSPTEQKYFELWKQQGFSLMIILRAVIMTKEQLGRWKFSYCRGILTKWHEANVHTLAEIEEYEKAYRRQLS